MQQRSLFNLPVRKPSAQIQQQIAQAAWTPAEGDAVTLPYMNDGIDAQIVHVHTERLGKEDQHPYKCWVPRLKIHVWQRKDQLERKV